MGNETCYLNRANIRSLLLEAEDESREFEKLLEDVHDWEEEEAREEEYGYKPKKQVDIMLTYNLKEKSGYIL